MKKKVELTARASCLAINAGTAPFYKVFNDGHWMAAVIYEHEKYFSAQSSLGNLFYCDLVSEFPAGYPPGEFKRELVKMDYYTLFKFDPSAGLEFHLNPTLEEIRKDLEKCEESEWVGANKQLYVDELAILEKEIIHFDIVEFQTLFRKTFTFHHLYEGDFKNVALVTRKKPKLESMKELLLKPLFQLFEAELKSKGGRK